MYTKSTNHHPTHALYEAEAALRKFRQSDNMSNSDFLEKFKSLLDIDIHASGDPGCTSARYRDFTLETEDPATIPLIMNWPSNVFVTTGLA
jgi:hypothetical protein